MSRLSIQVSNDDQQEISVLFLALAPVSVCDDPFTKETGIVIQPANTDDSTPQIRAQMLTGNVIWDISNTSAETLPVAAQNGWLEKIDWDLIDPEHKLPDVA